MNIGRSIHTVKLAMELSVLSVDQEMSGNMGMTHLKIIGVFTNAISAIYSYIELKSSNEQLRFFNFASSF